MKCLIPCCLMALLSVANAWSTNGHLIVANIAQDILQQKAPNTMVKCDYMLKYLQEYNATLTANEDNHTFVEAATFADDWKYHGHAWQGDFHFLQTPYMPEGGTIDDYNPSTKTRNLSAAIPYIVQWLSERDDGDDYLDSYIYDYISVNLYPDEPEVQQSYALRLLIHYMGDLHQPLHNEDKFTEADVKGDNGANSFDLPYHYGADELHAVFDILMYTQHNSIGRPITNEDWDDLQVNVNDIWTRNQDCVSDPAVYETLDFWAVTNESYDLGVTLYDGITEGEALPQDYIDTNTVMVEQQVVKAGYRLAYLLHYMYPTFEGEVFDQSYIE